MASVKTGIIIGVIIAVIGVIAILSVFETNSNDVLDISQKTSEIIESDENKFPINEEGKKIVVVIEAKDSLSIND
jgi:hypothetical protein